MKTKFFRNLISFWEDSFTYSLGGPFFFLIMVLASIAIPVVVFVDLHSNLWIFPISILSFGSLNWISLCSDLSKDHKLWFSIFEFALLDIVGWVFIILVFKICF